MDLFVVPTFGLDLLYVLVIVRLGADSLSGSTSHRVQLRSGSAHQITEAFPWNEAPRYLIVIEIRPTALR
jgi:hypothetical protein